MHHTKTMKKLTSQTRKLISNNIAPKLTARYTHNVYTLPSTHNSHNPTYCIGGAMIGTELSSAHGKAFPLGNVITCTHSSVSVFLFHWRKILNEMPAWPFAIPVLPDCTPLLHLPLLLFSGHCIHTKRCNNWAVWPALLPWSVTISCLRFYQ